MFVSKSSMRRRETGENKRDRARSQSPASRFHCWGGCRGDALSRESQGTASGDLIDSCNWHCPSSVALGMSQMHERQRRLLVESGAVSPGAIPQLLFLFLLCLVSPSTLSGRPQHLVQQGNVVYARCNTSRQEQVVSHDNMKGSCLHVVDTLALPCWATEPLTCTRPRAKIHGQGEFTLIIDR